MKGLLPNQTKKLETTATERATIELQHTTLAISIIFSNRYIPVVFHNLRGYDSHLIIKKAFEFVKEGEKIDAIPNSGENFMTFSIGN